MKILGNALRSKDSVIVGLVRDGAPSLQGTEGESGGVRGRAMGARVVRDARSLGLPRDVLPLLLDKKRRHRAGVSHR